MKHNTKKGFTLVELLVVIAILAILATVSVVGYTSFIDSTNRAVDEQTVAQLNHFLTAYMANHKSTHYGQPITEENGREIVLEVLELSGLGEIETVTADKGNYIYLKVENGEAEFVLASEDEAMPSAAFRFFNFWSHVVSGATEKPNTFNHATCFTKPGYVFASTAGSKLADAVRAFETAKNVPEGKEFNEEYLFGLMDVNTDLAKLAQVTVFVTKNGNISYEGAEVLYNTAYHDDEELSVQEVPEITIVTDENGVVQNPVTVPDNVVLGDNAIDIKYETPEHEEQAAGSAINILMSAEELANKLAETAIKLYTKFLLKGNETGILQEGTGENEGYFVIKVGTREYRLKYKNAMDSFDLVTEHVAGKVVTSTNAANIFWDYTGSIQLKVTNTIGENSKLPASSKRVTWSMDENDYVTLTEDGVLTLKNDQIAPISGENVFTVKATSKVAKEDGSYASQTFTVTIVTINDVEDITLEGNNVDLNNNTTPIDLYYGQLGTGANKDTFTFDFSKINLVHGAEFVIDGDATITASVDSEDKVFEVIDGTTLKLKAGVKEGTSTVTIRVGNFLEREIKVAVYDASQLYFEAANSGITHIGNQNEVLVSDLIKLKDGATWPTNATVSLVIYQAPLAQQAFGDYQKVPTSGAGITVNSNTIVITPSTMNQTIKFNGTETVHFVVTIAGANGQPVRASADYVVDVKNGYNVKQYSDIKTNTSNMFLNDIELPSGTIAFSNAGTIYGNHFTFNIEKGATTGYNGIITLENTNMRDLRVIGALYPQVGIGGLDPYGTNAVLAKGTVTIDNCYIANCRAPLSVGYETGDHNITVKNSVIFGGRYCNVEVRGGTLNFEGKVYSINQPHTNASNIDSVNVNDKIAGMGVTVWIEAPQGTDIQGVGNLVQYTFIPQTYTNLPVITISASSITASVDTADLFNTIFTGTEWVGDCTKSESSGGCGGESHSHSEACGMTQQLKYRDYFFTDSNGTKYINTSVLGEDLGSLVSSLGGLLGKDIPTGDRTGLDDDTSLTDLYSYQNISVKTDNALVSSVTMHTYLILGTRTDLFEGSKNAEYFFSPWTQTSGTQTYNAYNFGANGSILPQ